MVGLGFRAAEDRASIRQESLFIAQASPLPLTCVCVFCCLTKRDGRALAATSRVLRHFAPHTRAVGARTYCHTAAG